MPETTRFFRVPGGTQHTTYRKLDPQAERLLTQDGYRKLTPAALEAASLAARFTSLPEGVTRPVQLLGAVKAAAPFIGLSARLIFALDWLFRFTQPQDWQAGSRPIVWPSARLQGEELMLSPTRVKALNRDLIEAGLICAADSANGKRYGRRDAAGNIIEAYGFDLSPLAMRYEEFRAAAAEGRELRANAAQARRRITIARRQIRQIREVAEDYGFMTAGSALARVLGEASQTLATLAGEGRAEAREELILLLESQVVAARSAVRSRTGELNVSEISGEARKADWPSRPLSRPRGGAAPSGAVRTVSGIKDEGYIASSNKLTPAAGTNDKMQYAQVETSPHAVGSPVRKVNKSGTPHPKGAAFRPHIINYKPIQHPYQDTVKGLGAHRSTGPVELTFNSRDDADAKTQKKTGACPAGLAGGSASEMVEIAPRLKAFLDNAADPEQPDWGDIVTAADFLAQDMGISRPLWVEACDLLSEKDAAIALAIVSAKDPDYFTRTPGHYFRGMVRKAYAGELHLTRSLWGLREACGVGRKMREAADPS